MVGGEVVDERAEGEVEYVVGGEEEDVVVGGECVEGEEEVADGSEAVFVVGGAVVDYGDGFGVVLL